AHLTPLTKSGVDEVVLITDEMVAPMDGVVYECPPQLMQKLLSRGRRQVCLVDRLWFSSQA
ncbi:hypothetical protein QQ73_18120, partial [Candidatus Endoriftia persephone str. Guaymas]|nr:hypothetical protein [Candidatus Endoriftia persephone str. Guaymas]